MKRILLFISLISLIMPVILADYAYMSFRMTDGTVTTVSSENLEMSVSGSSLIVKNGTDADKSFVLTDLSAMYFSDNAGTMVETDDVSVLDSSTVTVVWSEQSAVVTMSDGAKQYVTATVNGADVSLVQSDKVSETVCGEITYNLSGSSSDGSFSLTGSYKSTINLRGLTLTNPTGAAIDIQNGKRINVSIKSGTTNVLTDGEGGNWKGAFQCKGHTEFKGKGTLFVYGRTAHAIWGKEYMEQKNCTINVKSAVKDGLNCNQYFLMESGLLNISGFLDDGIQVSVKDSTSGDAEDTGNFLQTDGVINIYMAGASGNGVKYEGIMKRTGGELNIINGEDGLEEVNINENSRLTLYSLLGVRMGEYDSLRAALAVLPKGIYIVRQESATAKILVR